MFFLQNNKDFRPKAFPRSSLAVGRDYLWLMFCTCSVYVQYLFSVRPNMYRTSTEELSNIIRDFSVAIPLLHYGNSEGTPSPRPNVPLRCYSITDYSFSISDFSLLFGKAAVDTDTEYSFVFSIQLFSYSVLFLRWQLTVDSFVFQLFGWRHLDPNTLLSI